MFYLCTVETKDLVTVFGSNTPEQKIEPKYTDLNIIILGQKMESGSAVGYLIFSDRVVSEFTQQSSVPDGYEFIFRQEWGLTITEEILHRVISTLRAESYPPLSDYVDAKVKGDTQQEQAHLAACLAVKEKYPKFSW